MLIKIIENIKVICFQFETGPVIMMVKMKHVRSMFIILQERQAYSKQFYCCQISYEGRLLLVAPEENGKRRLIQV